RSSIRSVAEPDRTMALLRGGIVLAIGGSGRMIETIDVKRIVPTEKQYAWTFGGVDPIARIKPGDVLDLFTEDCFGGRVRSQKDLPSKSIEYPFINPQTGPFYVEGAEPGDTLAIHLIDVQPAHDWAA